MCNDFTSGFLHLDKYAEARNVKKTIIDVSETN
jgi:hypothetical protein